MTKCKEYDYSQGKFIPMRFDKQIVLRKYFIILQRKDSQMGGKFRTKEKAIAFGLFQQIFSVLENGRQY